MTTEDERRNLEQSSLKHLSYIYWDDMWNVDEGYSYETQSESD